MIIQYLKRKDIDTEKYDACIQNAVNSRIYALSYYLDIVADNWDVLIYNNYQAVMPLPWRSKYLIKYIYPPCWTQQLGVFSIDRIDLQLADKFVKAIPKNFLKTTIYFNSECQSSLNLPHRTNYTLSLNNEYQSLFKKYRKDRKDRLKKFNNTGLKIETENNLTDLIELFKENYKGNVNLNNTDYLKLINISNQKKIHSFVLKIFNIDGELISGSLFVKDQFRIYYLFSANNAEGNKKQGNTAVLDCVINTYANTQYTLDFEGSMIPGIASFFKSFGSELESYFMYTKRF